MASTQTSYLNSSVGTSPATVFTASATTALVGMQCANISGAAITVDVYITRSATNYYLIKGATIPVGGALALGGLWKAFSGGDVEMDPADLAELQKHLKVLDQYGQDPAVKSGLPADVQKRLDAVIAKLDKLKKAKAAGGAAPAAFWRVSCLPCSSDGRSVW